jgi:hypothetical protein
MAIVGINLTKISSEKTGDVKGKISVRNNVIIRSVEEASFGLAMKQKGINIGFSFNSTYEPSVGKIEIEGKVLALESEENAKAIMAGWTSAKKIHPVLMQQVFTTVLRKCNIKALMLSEELGLPSPIKLPEVKIRTSSEPAKPAVPGQKPAPAAIQKPGVQKTLQKPELKK